MPITDQEKLVFALKAPKEVCGLPALLGDYKEYRSQLERPRSFLKWYFGDLRERKEMFKGVPFWK